MVQDTKWELHQSWLPDQNIAVLDVVSLGQKALTSHVG